MNSAKSQKIIKSSLDLDLVDETVRGAIDQLAENEKLQFLQKFFFLKSSHANSIKIIKNEKTINLLWPIPRINQEAEKHHKEAIQAARLKQLKKAISEWEAATEIDPYNPEYLFHLGIAYYETKSFDSAIQSLERAISICPILQKAYLILGMSYLKMRKFDQARSYLEKCLTFERKNLLIYLNLGSVYGILKEYDRAEEMFMKSIQLSPKEPRPYFGLAKIYATLGKNNEANNFFRKVIELDKSGALANYAKRAITVTQPQTVEPELHEAKQIPPELKENPEQFYTKGYRFFLQGNFKQAIQMYQLYLQIKPTDDYVWYALGEAQLRAGSVENAIQSFKKAAKISPQKGLYYKEMAIGFYYLNDWEKLAAAAKKALDLGKNDSLVYCLLGKAQLELGNLNESIVLLDKSLKKNSNSLLAKFFIAQSLIKRNELQDAAFYLQEIISSRLKSPLKNQAQQLMKQIQSM